MADATKKILVPIDFEEQSLIALNQACNLAKVISADITLLHVIEETGGVLSRLLSKQQHEEFKKEAEKELNKLAKDNEKNSKIKFTTLVARGTVYEKINEIAEMLNATFIVMGCNGAKKGLKKRFIGSNALRVVREARTPVISIKGKHHRAGCKNIVLPLDLTKETKEKVNHAIDFSNLYGGATIRVVSVLFTADEFVVNRLTRQLGQVKTFIEKAGIECTAEIIKGTKGEESLAQSIIDYANKVEGDLLMIMTQQEMDFTKYFIGSTAQEIINNSDIPVLSVIPQMKKDLIVNPIFKP